MVDMNTWDEIKATGGLKALKAFDKLWFRKEPLAPDEELMLRGLFNKYPLGQISFGKWSKQTVRQLWDKTWQKEVIVAGKD